MSAYLGPRAAKPVRPACTGRAPRPPCRSAQECGAHLLGRPVPTYEYVGAKPTSY